MPTIDPSELESRLAGDFQLAQKRAGEFSTAIGIDEPKGEKKERLMARGLRIKGKLIGQEELNTIDMNIKNLVDDLTRQAGFTNLKEEGAYKIKQQQEFNQFRESLMKQGLMLEQQLKESMLDAETAAKIQGQFGEVAQAAGFAFAMKGMGGTGNPGLQSAYINTGGGTQVASQASLQSYQANIGGGQ